MQNHFLLILYLEEQQLNQTHNAACHVCRFFDAEETYCRVCPTCSETFPADMSDDAFTEHQVAHFGVLCPICKMAKVINV